jgi:hypothetical protein
MKSLFKFILICTFSMLVSCERTNPQLFELIQEIKIQNNELLNQVKSLQTKSDLLIAELRISSAKQEELLTKVTELQNQLSSILSQIALLNKQLENQSTDIKLVKDKLAELQTQYQGIVVQLQELQKLSQILAEIEKMKTQFTQLDARYVTILAGLVQNKQELDALKIQITAIQTQLANNLTKLGLLTSQLDDQDVVISNILKQIELIKNSNAELIKILENLLLGKSPIPTNGLVAWYPFNGNANDESGNGNNGIVNGASLTTDRFGNLNEAFSFNGITNFIEVPTSKSIEFTNSYTLSGWFNADIWFGTSISDRTIISKNACTGGSGGYEIMIGGNDGNIANTGVITGKSFVLRSTGYSINNWYMVTATFDGSTVKLYVNGILTNSQAISGSIQNSSQPLHFGRRCGGSIYDQWFKGEIDDFRLYNRALTQNEINSLFINK